MMDYLSDLLNNNDREWYHAHKRENKLATEQFEQLVQKLILGIGTFDESVLNNDPKSLTFKLVRDTRFSHDKAHAEQEPCDLQFEFDLKNILLTKTDTA